MQRRANQDFAHDENFANFFSLSIGMAEGISQPPFNSSDRLAARRNKITAATGRKLSTNQSPAWGGKEETAVPAGGMAMPMWGCGPLPMARP
jgi:hypothetical protein